MDRTTRRGLIVSGSASVGVAAVGTALIENGTIPALIVRPGLLLDRSEPGNSGATVTKELLPELACKLPRFVDEYLPS